MQHKITVLGIHFFHDAGAAVVQNGKILAAINEEKIINVKHAAGYPVKSIEEVLKIAKIHPSEIDAIALTGIIDLKFPKDFARFPNFSDAFLNWSLLTKHHKGLELIHSHHFRIQKIEGMKKILAKIGIPLKKIFFIDHHLAHAASAYYLSPWSFDENILVLTSDGLGDGISSTVSLGYKGEINRLENSETSYANSLGSFYSSITAYLGMNWAFDPFKTMGLAPYGKSSKTINEIKQLIGIDPENPLRFKNKTGRIFIEKMQPKLEELLRGKRFDDIAAATQEWFEKLTTTWVSNAIEKTKVHKIACSGGTFLNVKANRAILSLDCVEDAFFCPAAGDEGLAVGAALVGYFEMTTLSGKKPEKVPISSIYFGTSFSNEEIESSLKKHNLLENAQFVDDIDGEIGELISKPDTIVARFSGAMEWGPRGLGNRSILADPSNPNIVRKINKAIKMRDFWMPFGPSILSSRMDEYLIDAEIAPYMILAFDTTEKRNDLAAAIHPYDLTCRPQTVNSEYNKNYETVLKSFESKTGIGGILNTSFNLHGFPIVYSPDIAINTFKNSKLDVLSLGNYLIKK